MMRVQVQLNDRFFRSFRAASVRAAEAAVQSVHGDVVSAQVMPFRSGDMQKTKTRTQVVDAGDKIIASILTSGPYARRLYYHPEYTFFRAKNPNAQGQWLRPWIDGENKDAFRRAFIAQLRKEANP